MTQVYKSKLNASKSTYSTEHDKIVDSAAIQQRAQTNVQYKC